MLQDRSGVVVAVLARGNLFYWDKGMFQNNKFPLANTETTTPDLSCSIISSTQTKSKLEAFLHGTIFSLMSSTLLISIKCDHFTTWPGLTTSLITKHLSKSISTSKGRLCGQQKQFQSTKFIKDSTPLATSLEIAPKQEPTNPHTQQAFTIIVDQK